MAAWRDSLMEDLARQLAYSPADKRADQLQAAVELLETVAAGRGYPWEFVLFRLTGYRPTVPVEHTVPGVLLRADLSRLIEALSETLDLRAAEAGVGVLDLEGVTKRFGVSSKTIQRWRRKGLVAQRYIFPDGRRRLGFAVPAVGRFAGTHAGEVAAAGRFRQVSPREREIILTHARRLATRCKCCLKEISRRLAGKLKRSPETIRYMIRQFDREHPAEAIFPDTAAPIRALDRAMILDCFDRGVPVECLAKRYCRTRSSIYRVVGQQRAEKLKAVLIEFVANPLFELPEADKILLEELPREALAQAAAGKDGAEKGDEMLAARVPHGLPAYLATMFRQPVLAAPVETDLFRRMNYLKFKARQLQGKLDVTRATAVELADIEALLAQANRIKNELVQANLRVGVHVARKHQRPGADLMELVSDATIWLLRAVERFDFARGVKFSTYASYAVMKNFARDRGDQLTRRDGHWMTGQEETLAQIAGPEGLIAEQVDATAARADLVAAIAELPARDQRLLRAHYGLEETPRLSLAELGTHLGITKSRVRQLETRALRKLRRLIEARRGGPSAESLVENGPE